MQCKRCDSLPLTFVESRVSLDQYGPGVFFLITIYIPRSFFVYFDSYRDGNKHPQPKHSHQTLGRIVNCARRGSTYSLHINTHWAWIMSQGIMLAPCWNILQVSKCCGLSYHLLYRYLRDNLLHKLKLTGILPPLRPSHPLKCQLVFT